MKAERGMTYDALVIAVTAVGGTAAAAAASEVRE
jgi:hypothetical protein